MENRKTGSPSEARGSIKEAIGKVTGDVHAEAEGAAEVKAARKRDREASNSSDDAEEIRARVNRSGMNRCRDR